jgi:hypothetical protein
MFSYDMSNEFCLLVSSLMIANTLINMGLSETLQEGRNVQTTATVETVPDHIRPHLAFNFHNLAFSTSRTNRISVSPSISLCYIAQ